MGLLSKACHGVLRLCGWHSSLTWPPEPRGLIMVYPHTSNWDFPIGVLFKLAHNLPAQWMGKDSMFRWPFRRLLLALGGVPINRRERTGFVEQMRAALDAHDDFRLVITPEGTRGRTERWKSGFWHLARAAGVGGTGGGGGAGATGGTRGMRVACLRSGSSAWLVPAIGSNR